MLCVWLRTPLPWVIGPLLAMAVGKICGLHLAAAPFGRQAGQLVIASALGLYFTPQVLQQLLDYGLFMILGGLLAVAIGFLGAWILHRLTDTDWATAYFASVPGGAAEMSILGENFGARVERIALSQSVRVALIVLVVPAAIMASGAHGSDAYQTPTLAVRHPQLELVLVLAGLGGVALSRLRVPNAWMLGPLFVSIALNLSSSGLSGIPTPLSNTGQLLIGCALGSRFERSFMLSAPRFLVAVTLSVAAALAMATAFALLFASLTRLPTATMLLALTPGGIAEICVTAKVLQLGVPVVTAFHVVRLVILVTCGGPIFRLLHGENGGRGQ
jgi:membrane AbrB-like protein